MDARRDRVHAHEGHRSALLRRRALQPRGLPGDAGHAPRREGAEQTPAARRALHDRVHAGARLTFRLVNGLDRPWRSIVSGSVRAWALAALVVVGTAGVAHAQLFLGSRPDTELAVGP